LGRKSPTKTSELLDIATNFNTGEEEVGAIFSDAKGNGRRMPLRVPPPVTLKRKRTKAGRESNSVRRTPSLPQ
jgi:hypothetical protein